MKFPLDPPPRPSATGPPRGRPPEPPDPGPRLNLPETSEECWERGCSARGGGGKVDEVPEGPVVGGLLPPLAPELFFSGPHHHFVGLRRTAKNLVVASARRRTASSWGRSFAAGERGARGGWKVGISMEGLLPPWPPDPRPTKPRRCFFLGHTTTSWACRRTPPRTAGPQKKPQKSVKKIGFKTVFIHNSPRSLEVRGEAGDGRAAGSPPGGEPQHPCRGCSA